MFTRRKIVQAIALLSAASQSPNVALASSSVPSNSQLLKTIPSSGQQLPTIGMGTWITFDQNPESGDLVNYIQILNAFFSHGGQLIDSSPMYGYAQQLLGSVLAKTEDANELFSATKVWVPGKQLGIEQMDQSMKLWGVDSMDLMMVHNMLDWRSHLPTLNAWKQAGKIKYTGITTSHGRRHSDLIAMLKANPVDFVQFSYNIHDREAEEYLLPLAQDLGMAVIINRPFQTGGLFQRVKNQPLPDWAVEIQCENWAQFFLKFVISHPAVTCAIPATSQVSHMHQNMTAMTGVMPDQKMRQKMLAYYQTIN